MRISDWSSNVCSSDLAAKAEGFWQEAPDIGVSGRPAETLDPRGPHPDVLDLNTHPFDRAVRTYDILECRSYPKAEFPSGPPEISCDTCGDEGRGGLGHLTESGPLGPDKGKTAKRRRG